MAKKEKFDEQKEMNFIHQYIDPKDERYDGVSFLSQQMVKDVVFKLVTDANSVILKKYVKQASEEVEVAIIEQLMGNKNTLEEKEEERILRYKKAIKEDVELATIITKDLLLKYYVNLTI